MLLIGVRDRIIFYLDFVVEKPINQMSVAVNVGGGAVAVTVTTAAAAMRFSVVVVVVVVRVVRIAPRQVTLKTEKFFERT